MACWIDIDAGFVCPFAKAVVFSQSLDTGGLGMTFGHSPHSKRIALEAKAQNGNSIDPLVEQGSAAAGDVMDRRAPLALSVETGKQEKLLLGHIAPRGGDELGVLSTVPSSPDEDEAVKVMMQAHYSARGGGGQYALAISSERKDMDNILALRTTPMARYRRAQGALLPFHQTQATNFSASFS
ncbi:hypothetical protein S40285_10343 [Stachybotrys chlorohalonatus IBT 40285]|uniref:Uncharacterized protein n=1 Tax=Stachybotrys chlorohalonatus (strain IBT 40285) TaxID=1283841 RepID=A0A084QF54_STAC4|nr:hypothetical protein S40285_10343 [Stachybotrys chlorohalonata IBT 40285]